MIILALGASMSITRLHKELKRCKYVLNHTVTGSFKIISILFLRLHKNM